MTTGFEVFNVTGQRIASNLDRQLVLTHKGTYVTQKHGGASYSVKLAWFKTFVVKYKPSIIAIKASDYCFYTCYYQSVTKDWQVTIYSRTLSVTATVYVYSDVSDVQPNPSTRGAGFEIYDSNGKVTYSTVYRHFILDSITVTNQSPSSYPNVGVGKALAVSCFPATTSYSGNINSGDGANVNWIVRGFYVDSSGQVQPVWINESVTSEYEYPVNYSYTYSVVFMGVNTSNIDRVYPNGYTMP